MKNSSKKKPSKTPNKLKKPKKTSKIDQNRPKIIQKSSKTHFFQKINFFQLFRPPRTQKSIKSTTSPKESIKNRPFECNFPQISNKSVISNPNFKKLNSIPKIKKNSTISPLKNMLQTPKLSISKKINQINDFPTEKHHFKSNHQKTSSHSS
jgi:hypothetical protein